MAETTDSETFLEELRVDIKEVGTGYEVAVVTVMSDGRIAGERNRQVASYTGDLLKAASDTANDLIAELRAIVPPTAETTTTDGPQLSREQTFVEAWEASSGDDFASRMARRSLEASAAQTPALQDVLARLRGV